MQKFKFDARMDQNSNNGDFYNNSWKYSFLHNFKVHYKVSVLQALANKVDVSISSSSPQIPSTQLVMDEFNKRMQMGNVAQNRRQRFSAASYHVTNVEYKESFAFYDPQAAPSGPPQSFQAANQPQIQPALGPAVFCRNCGARLPTDSKFCNHCGVAVAT